MGSVQTLNFGIQILRSGMFCFCFSMFHLIISSMLSNYSDIIDLFFIFFQIVWFVKKNEKEVNKDEKNEEWNVY